MRRALVVVAGAALLACAIVALAPAGLLDRLVASRTDGRLRLADASGLWWRGRGVVTASTTGARLPIAWRVRVLALAGGRLVVDFVPAQPGMPSGVLAIAGDDVETRALELTLPAQLLPAFAPALAPVAPEGAIEVRSASFAWRPLQSQGRIDVAWHDAQLALAGFPISLGDVRGAASGTAEGIGGTFDNRGGDLGVRGTWSMRGDRIEGLTTLAASDATPPALRAVLPMLGQPDARGDVRIEWRGRR